MNNKKNEFTAVGLYEILTSGKALPGLRLLSHPTPIETERALALVSFVEYQRLDIEGNPVAKVALKNAQFFFDNWKALGGEATLN